MGASFRQSDEQPHPTHSHSTLPEPALITFRQNFYVMYGKRALDIFGSALGLMVLCPAFFVVGCLVKLTSQGPILYRQMRVGRNGREFQILKFRSMIADAAKKGSAITVHGDPRITRFGKFLRRYKIDELPQLWNVLCGQMSLVGPRPELPSYVAAYTSEQRRILSSRPGITDPATLVYRHEEELLAKCDDPEQFYRTQVLSDKLRRNLAYLQDISFNGDVRILFETIACSLRLAKAIREKGPRVATPGD